MQMRIHFDRNSTHRCQASATEHSEYVRVNASVTEGLPAVNALIRVLQSLGGELLDPSERRGMNPLLVPLVKREDGAVVALLRLPQTVSVQGMSVVQTRPESSSYLELLGRSPDEFIHRALAEEDYNNGQIGAPERPVAEAASDYGLRLYEQGNVERSGLPSLNAYIARRVGMFLDVSEALVQAHFEKNDPMSALITAEWYMRDGQFPNWGKPYEYVSDLMIDRLNRKEEGRDIARLALKSPWWTLEKGFEHARKNSGLAGDPDAIRSILMEQEEANMSAMQGGSKTNHKTSREQYLDDASHLLNKVAAGELAWSDILSELELKYELAGLIDMARFVAMI
jgi:hypothetical protein